MARRQALQEGLRAVRDGTAASAALLADPEWSGHVLGGVAALLTVAEGAQEAITAALGGAADAVAVAGLDAAVAILHGLKGADAGTAGLVIAEAGPGPGQHRTGPVRAPAPGSEGLPPGVIPAIDLVKAPGELSAAVAGLLAGVVVADDLGRARELVVPVPSCAWSPGMATCSAPTGRTGARPSRRACWPCARRPRRRRRDWPRPGGPPRRPLPRWPRP